MYTYNYLQSTGFASSVAARMACVASASPRPILRPRVAATRPTTRPPTKTTTFASSSPSSAAFDGGVSARRRLPRGASTIAAARGGGRAAGRGGGGRGGRKSTGGAVKRYKKEASRAIDLEEEALALELEADAARVTSPSSSSSNPPRAARGAKEKRGGSGSRGTNVFPASMDRPTTVGEQLQFERKGHCVLRGVLSREEAAGMITELMHETKARTLQAYRHRVAVLVPGYDVSSITSVDDALRVLEHETDEEIGFLQTFNLHRPDPDDVSGREPAAAKFILSRRLARVAYELLDAREGDKVRLYQSCVFAKPPGFAATHWHSDGNMVPLDTNKFITLWMPLRDLDEDDAALVFASGSHRDFSLPYWHSLEGMSDLSGRGYEVESYDPLSIGDATAHSGWTLHWSPPQPEDRETRYALSVCYFLDGARRLGIGGAESLRQTPHGEDEWSWREWIDDVDEGKAARHPALPVVYP